jgi:hypothetical protein
MKQALHIFRKDVAHLWPMIAIVQLLVGGFAVSTVRSSDRAAYEQLQLGFLTSLLSVLVPAAYAWLIVTVVHQEALSGDRQFWLTRPYRVGSLLAAKALFILLFVCASMLAKDWFIVATLGFPLLSNITGLLLRQFAWTAWIVLPALAVAAVTRKLQEVGLVGAGLALLYALVVRKAFWPGIEWVRDYFGMFLLLTLCIAIILWQYLRRETSKARTAVAFGSVLVIVGLPALPWNAAFAVQMLIQRPRIDLAQVQITTDLLRARSTAPEGAIGPGPVTVALPLRLKGLPRGMTVAGDGVRITIASGDGKIWRSGWQQNWFAEKTEDYTSQMVQIDNRVYRSLRDRPISVRLSLGLTVLENGQSVHVPAHQQNFSFEGSRCEDRSPDSYPPPIWCLAALKAPPAAVLALETSGSAKEITRFGAVSYAPYEVLLDQNPIALEGVSLLELRGDSRALWESADAQIVLTPQRPIAHLRRDLEFPEVRLADYVLPRPELRFFTIPR